MTILVVDDAPVMRQIMTRSLRHAGYGHLRVEEAADGIEGLDKARRVRPSIILSDWQMPNMTGIELVRVLRAEAIDTPFGLVTSESSADQRALAIAEGVDFVLGKPFTPGELGAELENYL